jgi:hypothetical protein
MFGWPTNPRHSRVDGMDIHVVHDCLPAQAKEMELSHSPESVIDILKTIYMVTLQTPYSNNFHKRLVLKNKEQLELAKIFNFQI